MQGEGGGENRRVDGGPEGLWEEGEMNEKGGGGCL